MTTIETGGPAFPSLRELGDIATTDDGMALRDYLAAKVLPAVYADYCVSARQIGFNEKWKVGVAIDAYQMADAMLAARASGTPAFDPVFLQRVDGIGDGDLCLTARSQNSLKGAGIYLVGDLVQRSERDLLVIQGLTSKSAHEIKEALAGLGLTLGMKLDNWPKGRRVDQG